MAKPSRNICFQLKADFLPFTTLKLTQMDAQVFRTQIEATIVKAPQYFTNAPIIVDFTQVSDAPCSEGVLKEMIAVLHQYQMIPVAVRGFPKQSLLPNLPDTIQKASQKEKEKPIDTVKEPTKMITKPVRAGTQVYAKNADLVVVAAVNAGAEVIADGNIHIYGPLRGRALAGANGDVNARIFCHDLDAELVAIAGHYLLSDQINARMNSKGIAHVFLENEAIQVETI